MKRWRLVLAVILILIFSFLIYPFLFTGKIKSNFNIGIKPISMLTTNISQKFENFFKEIFFLRSIVKQNNELINENLELQSKLAKYENTAFENEVLKKELGFYKGPKSNELISSDIISRGTGGYTRTLVIDKGLDAGAQQGQAVLSQGFLIGVISKASKETAEVILINDFNSLVPVSLEKSGGTGLVRGGLGGLIIDDIPLNTTLISNENVVTSSLSDKIPPGILVGKTTENISKKGDIFGRIKVDSPIDFSNLKILFVMKSPYAS